MITIEQCRGARGLVGWTQQDLAEASGLSKTAINNFEKGHSDIKAESLRAIRMAFESADIEFIGTEGIRQRADRVDIFKGGNARQELIEDICNTVDAGQEILILNTNTTGPAFDTERLERQNIAILCILAADAENMSIAHRTAPATEDRAPVTTFVYGQKFATELPDQSMILVVSSKEAVESQRRHFEALWLNAAETAGASATANNSSNA